MPSTFEKVGNYSDSGECAVCGATAVPTLEATTASEFLQDVQLCMSCFANIARVHTRSGSSTSRIAEKKQGRPSKRNGTVPVAEVIASDPGAGDQIPHATLFGQIRAME